MALWQKKKRSFLFISGIFFINSVTLFVEFFRAAAFNWTFSARQKPTQQETKEKRENNRYKSFVAWWYFQYDIAVVVVVVVAVVAYSTFHWYCPYNLYSRVEWFFFILQKTALTNTQWSGMILEVQSKFLVHGGKVLIFKNFLGA